MKLVDVFSKGYSIRQHFEAAIVGPEKEALRTARKAARVVGKKTDVGDYDIGGEEDKVGDEHGGYVAKGDGKGRKIPIWFYAAAAFKAFEDSIEGGPPSKFMPPGMTSSTDAKPKTASATSSASTGTAPEIKGAGFQLVKEWGPLGGWSSTPELLPVLAEEQWPAFLGIKYPGGWPYTVVSGWTLDKQAPVAVPGFAGLCAPFYGLPEGTGVGTGFDSYATNVFDITDAALAASSGVPEGSLDPLKRAGLDTLGRVWPRYTPVLPGSASGATPGTTVASSPSTSSLFSGVTIFSPISVKLAAIAAGALIMIPPPPFGPMGPSSASPAPTTVDVSIPTFPTVPEPAPVFGGPEYYSFIYRIGKTGSRSKGEIGFYSDLGSVDFSKHDIEACWSAHLGGFVATGCHHDKHQKGISADKTEVNMGHLSVFSLFTDHRSVLFPSFEDPDGKNDAGLDFDLITPYEDPTSGPKKTFVYLRYNPKAFHQVGPALAADDEFWGGLPKYKGRWMWEADSWAGAAGGDGATSSPPAGSDGTPRRQSALNKWYGDFPCEMSFSSLSGKPVMYAANVLDTRNVKPDDLEAWQRDNFAPIVIRRDFVGDQLGTDWNYQQKPGASRNRSGTALGAEWSLPPEYGIENLQAGVDLGHFGSYSRSLRGFYGIDLGFGRPLAQAGALAQGFRITQPSATSLRFDYYADSSDGTFTGTPAAADGTAPLLLTRTGAGTGTLAVFGTNVGTTGQPFSDVQTKALDWTAAAGVFYMVSASKTMTLPKASTVTKGTLFTGFLNVGAVTTSIALADGGDTLQGASSFAGAGKTRMFMSDGGTNWLVVAGGN